MAPKLPPPCPPQPTTATLSFSLADLVSAASARPPPTQKPTLARALCLINCRRFVRRDMVCTPWEGKEEVVARLLSLQLYPVSCQQANGKRTRSNWRALLYARARSCSNKEVPSPPPAGSCRLQPFPGAGERGRGEGENAGADVVWPLTPNPSPPPA